MRRVDAFEATGKEQGPVIATVGGEVAVAWAELLPAAGSRHVDRYRIRVAFSRSGRAFGRPQTIVTAAQSTRDSESVAVAYGPRRRLTVAYATARRANGDRPVIAVRQRRPGHGFGRAQILGSREPLTDLTAAAGPSGRTAVAWGSQDSGEEAEHPWVVRAALRGASASRVGRAVVLDAGAARGRTRGDLQAVMGAGRDGDARMDQRQRIRALPAANRDRGSPRRLQFSD